MLDIGWTELLVIGIVALIVVGPKDLPVMFRTLGKYTGQARKMAREFSRAMDEAADEAGVKDIKRDLNAMTNPKDMGMDALKGATDFGDWSDEDLAAPSKAKPTASDKSGPATRKLAEERAEKAARLQESVSAKAAKSDTDDTAA